MDKEIEINGIKYIPKGSEQKTMVKLNTKGLTYCLVRTYSAGVFAGWIDRKIKGQENTVYEARRIWYWAGANSLSQLAVDGTNKPDECKFSVTTKEVDLKQVIELLPCTDKAKKSIESVKEWKL
jgi:hypothetical protein